MKTIVTDIPDYKTFIKGEKTVEIGYPWLTFGAIMALEKILIDSRGKFKILELGSGGSTVFFANRCKYLLTLENDEKWAEVVNKYIGFKEHVSILYRQTPSMVKEIKKLKDESFDLILIDSHSGGRAYHDRMRVMTPAIPKLKKGGWLVIDNYEHMKFDYTGYDVYTFDMFRYSGRGTKLCRKI